MKRIVFIAILSLSQNAFSWDGYDYESGSSIEIEKGNTVRRGREIEFYDYGSGEYRSGEVESIRRSGGNVEVEVTDSETGEARSFEMDGN